VELHQRLVEVHQRLLKLHRRLVKLHQWQVEPGQRLLMRDAVCFSPMRTTPNIAGDVGVAGLPAGNSTGRASDGLARSRPRPTLRDDRGHPTRTPPRSRDFDTSSRNP
jgi:hypothetical protein